MLNAVLFADVIYFGRACSFCFSPDIVVVVDVPEFPFFSPLWLGSHSRYGIYVALSYMVCKSLILRIRQRALFHSKAQCSTNEPTLHNKCVNCHFHFLSLPLSSYKRTKYQTVLFWYVCTHIIIGEYIHSPYLTCLLRTFSHSICPYIF